MKKIILLLLLPYAVYAQEESWVKQIKGGSPSGNSNCHATITDHANNVIVTGSGFGYFRFSDGSAVGTPGETNGYVVKYSPAGAVLWARVLPDSINSAICAAVDSANNIYLAGITNGVGAAGYISKYDKNFKWIWSREVTGTSLSEFDNMVINKKAIYLSGFTYAGHNYTFGSHAIDGNKGQFLVKMDLSGSVTWITQPFESKAYVQDLRCDTENNTYSATNATYADSIVMSILKVNPSGRKIWQKKFKVNTTDQTRQDRIMSLAVHDSKIFFNGKFGGSLMTEDGTYAAEKVYDFFIASMDTSSTFNWIKINNIITSESGKPGRLTTNSSMEIYEVGLISGAATFGKLQVQSKQGCPSEIYLARYSNTGKLLSAYTGGGNSSWCDIDGSIACDHNDNIYYSGVFGGVGTFGYEVLTAAGGTDVFLVKHQDTYILGLTEHVNDAGIKLYPNPTKDKFTLQFEDRAREKIIITVTDILGRKIREEVKVKSDNEIQLDLSDFPTGLYLVDMSGESFHQIQRVIKN